MRIAAIDHDNDLGSGCARGAGMTAFGRAMSCALALACVVGMAGGLPSVGMAADPRAATDQPPADQAAVPQKPPTFEFRVTGMFCPERQDDLRQSVSKLPGLELIAIDYEHSVAEFAFDPKKFFDNAKPDDYAARLDDRLRSVSHSTFGAMPLSTTPSDKIERLEIRVVGLDCKGCGLAAYDAVYRIDGVEHATASFKNGLVVAWIDPGKTNRAALEAALVKANVQLATTP